MPVGKAVPKIEGKIQAIGSSLRLKGKYGKIVLKEDAEVDARLLRVDAETGRVEASMLAFKIPEEQEDAQAGASPCRLHPQEQPLKVVKNFQKRPPMYLNIIKRHFRHKNVL